MTLPFRPTATQRADPRVIARRSSVVLLVRWVQLMPSGEVITRLPVPEFPTATRIDFSGAQAMPDQLLSAALVRWVQVTPSGEVITRLPVPL